MVVSDLLGHDNIIASIHWLRAETKQDLKIYSPLRKCSWKILLQEKEIQLLQKKKSIPHCFFWRVNRIKPYFEYTIDNTIISFILIVLYYTIQTFIREKKKLYWVLWKMFTNTNFFNFVFFIRNVMSTSVSFCVWLSIWKHKYMVSV